MEFFETMGKSRCGHFCYFFDYATHTVDIKLVAIGMVGKHLAIYNNEDLHYSNKYC